MIKIYYVLSCLLLVSCIGGNSTPEEALSDYIYTLTKKNVTKDFYLNRTTGKLKESILSMSDEEFNEFNKIPKIKGRKVKVISKVCDELECSLTYLLSYTSGEEITYKNEIKKIALLQKVDGDWKIAEASNLKTYIESQSNIDISAK